MSCSTGSPTRTRHRSSASCRRSSPGASPSDGRRPLRQDGRMRIHIAADHAGFELKVHLMEHLRAAGHDVVDHGALAYEPDDDYPGVCIAAGEAVVAEPGSVALVIGGSRTLFAAICSPLP